MKPTFRNVCTCGQYQTAYDFDSDHIAVLAAKLHIMLPGKHVVTTYRRDRNGDLIFCETK